MDSISFKLSLSSLPSSLSLKPKSPSITHPSHFLSSPVWAPSQRLQASTKDPASVFNEKIDSDFNIHAMYVSGAPGEEGSFPEGLRRESMPDHVAVIMDGNRRWARMRGLPEVSGYQEGVRALRSVVDLCPKLGIRVLTVFAFSSENWFRPKVEVDFLMALFESGLKEELDNFMRASDYPSEYDGACLQMRLSYSPCAHIFLFLVQWSDCHLAGALGLLRILIYKAYEDGKTTMSVHERKASIREFYGMIFPSLLQLQRGITDVEDRKQREICAAKYRRRDEMDKGKLSEIEIERDEDCGICMEMCSKVVFPNCTHSLCMKCYRNWRSRSQSCPFCRDSLRRVNSGDLWIYTSCLETADPSSIEMENLKRLIMYIEKLPLLMPDPMRVSYDPRYR